MLGLGLGLSKGGVPTGSTGSTNTTVASYDFEDGIPGGWTKADSGNWTMYGSTNDTDLGGYQGNKGWLINGGAAGSNGTGPIGSHAGGVDSDSGASTTDGSILHLLYESSVPASNTSAIVAGAIRTEQLDFSNYSSVNMTFWFHAYGASFGENGGGGISLTDSATSSSSADEVGSGLGFTSATAGGATMTYTDLSGSSVSTVRLGHAGQVQTSGAEDDAATANEWIKATVDLSAAAGENKVYIHFGFFATSGSNGFTQDLGIDSIKIIGVG